MLTWWNSLPAEFKAALPGAGATLVAALLGVGGIVWQIGRQARAAIEQQRVSEAIKLKLGLYQDVVEVCQYVTDAEVAFSSFVQNFVAQLDTAATADAEGRPFSVPIGRVPELIRHQGNAHQTAIKIVTTVEQWRIVDPRMSVFQTALNVALHDMMDAYWGFWNVAMRLFPLDASPPGHVLPWQVPGVAERAAAAAAAERLCEATGLLECFVADFRDAMQFAMLGELFPNPLAPRKPLDPKYLVVTLDMHRELNAYFEAHSAWGRAKAEADAAVSSANPGTGAPVSLRADANPASGVCRAAAPDRPA